TGAMNEAYDVLLAARSRLEGRDAHYRKLFVVLLETTPVVEAGVGRPNAPVLRPPGMIARDREAGERCRADSPRPAGTAAAEVRWRPRWAWSQVCCATARVIGSSGATPRCGSGWPSTSTR